MSENAKFKYSASEGLIELEGSEEFVTSHFESVTDLARVISRHVVVEMKQTAHDVSHSPAPEEKLSAPLSTSAALQNSSAAIVPALQAESIDKYPNVYADINAKLKIVADIPGGSAKAKMLNAAILFCYGSKLLGDGQVASKDIRTVCEEHGCLDGANFSKIFTDRTIFLSDGVKGGNKDIKLTFLGEKKAKELLGSA